LAGTPLPPTGATPPICTAALGSGFVSGTANPGGGMLFIEKSIGVATTSAAVIFSASDGEG
jgi:hypothetical protein